MRCLNRPAAFLCALSVAWSAPAQAKPKVDAAKKADQKAKKTDWDVEQPKVASRQQAIDVQTGTWMSLDVSPDGKRIVLTVRDTSDLALGRTGPAWGNAGVSVRGQSAQHQLTVAVCVAWCCAMTWWMART